MTERLNNPVVTEHELGEIRALIETRSGIHFDESRERFLSTRVREHMEFKKLSYGAELLRSVRASNVEYDALLEKLLTQETRFYRYPDVFKAFEKKVLPEIHAKKFWETPRSLRVWSAGCSTGEEPYSIAISVADSLEFSEAWKLNILATDISKQALQYAERGVYPRRVLENLQGHQIENSFTKVGEQFAVKPKLKHMVTFAPMNLAQATYLGRFDVIFCMNVLIYFTDERRAALIQKFHEYLEPGGYLFLGHAESASGAPVKFNQIVYGDARLLQKPLAAPVVSSMPTSGLEEIR
jgi:chemotaxis protein methyltransferase CheR